MSSRQARIPISLDVLEHVLPPGTIIHGFIQNEFYRTVDLVVEHSSFAELNDGDVMPRVMLMIHKKFCKEGNHSHVSKVEYGS